jgi:hypothetical protein
MDPRTLTVVVSTLDVVCFENENYLGTGGMK